MTEIWKELEESAHRLVAKYFITNSGNKKEINHINGIKDDNRVVNLEWVTSKENKQPSLLVLKVGTLPGKRSPRRSIKGYHWDSSANRYRASVTFRGKKVYVGVFKTKREAKAAYESKANELFGVKK